MATHSKRIILTDSNTDGLISRISSTVSESPIFNQTKQVAAESAVVAKKLLWSTGRAAWISGTTFLILAVPLIIAMDREQQLNELDLQQESLLGTPNFATQS